MSKLTKKQSAFIGTQIQTLMNDLVLPALAEILIEDRNSKRQPVPVQVGTGFFTFVRSRRVLVTAKHCLLGHDFDEPIDNKLIFLKRLISIPKLKNVKICHSEKFDLSLIWSPEFDDLKPNFLRLGGKYSIKGPVTIGGFLARDFKRGYSSINPQPYFYSGKLLSDHGDLRFSIAGTNKGKVANSGARVTPPHPVGLSGCPLISTDELIHRRARAIGVFTSISSGRTEGIAEHINGLSSLW